MKKTLLTAVLALFSVVALAQEKPQNTEKHACTETCDHGKAETKSEMKACCSVAKAEGKECGHCTSKKSATAMVPVKKHVVLKANLKANRAETQGNQPKLPLLNLKKHVALKRKQNARIAEKNRLTAEKLKKARGSMSRGLFYSCYFTLPAR